MDKVMQGNQVTLPRHSLVMSPMDENPHDTDINEPIIDKFLDNLSEMAGIILSKGVGWWVRRRRWAELRNSRKARKINPYPLKTKPWKTKNPKFVVVDPAAAAAQKRKKRKKTQRKKEIPEIKTLKKKLNNNIKKLYEKFKKEAKKLKLKSRDKTYKNNNNKRKDTLKKNKKIKRKK